MCPDPFAPPNPVAAAFPQTAAPPPQINASTASATNGYAGRASADPFAALTGGGADATDPFSAAFGAASIAQGGSGGLSGGHAAGGGAGGLMTLADDPFAELTAQLNLGGPNALEGSNQPCTAAGADAAVTLNPFGGQAEAGGAGGGGSMRVQGRDGCLVPYGLAGGPGSGVGGASLNPFDMLDAPPQALGIAHTAGAQGAAHGAVGTGYSDPFLELLSSQDNAAAPPSVPISVPPQHPGAARIAGAANASVAPASVVASHPAAPLPPLPAGPPPPPPLPAGWEAAWSEDDKEYYFFREDTGQVTWDLPQ